MSCMNSAIAAEALPLLRGLKVWSKDQIAQYEYIAAEALPLLRGLKDTVGECHGYFIVSCRGIAPTEGTERK